MKPDMADIGQRIQKKRLAKHYTQAQLAEIVKLSSNHISGIETGRKTMSLNSLIDICSALNASADYIIFGDCPQTHLTISPSGATDDDEKILKRLHEIMEHIPEKSQENFLKLLTYMAPMIK